MWNRVINSVLDPDVLTIGFALRVPVQRLTLMLRGPRTPHALLTNEASGAVVVVRRIPSDDAGRS